MERYKIPGGFCSILAETKTRKECWKELLSADKEVPTVYLTTIVIMKSRQGVPDVAKWNAGV